MKFLLFVLSAALSWLFIISNYSIRESNNATTGNLNSPISFTQYVDNLYSDCELKDKLDFKVFNRAMTGYNSLNLSNRKVITIIDFSKPSTEERMFIIDLENRKLLLQTLVAHGKNSGWNKATEFSNTSASLKSSIGFYITGETYFGKHGYSLRLNGIEKGINDNARNRAIVVHGADYVSYSFIKKYHRLGRSWGCLAVNSKLSKKIIDLIKNGSCLFVYADVKDYHTQSIVSEIKMINFSPLSLSQKWKSQTF